jgi:ABC-type glycerol-3-phosphate transport system substrate-binding protein
MNRILVLIAVLLVSAAGLFAGGEVEEATTGPEPVTLEAMMFGNKPSLFDAVLEEFYARTEGVLNTTLDIEWNPTADHKQKLLLKMTAGERLDFVFDSTWMHLNTLARDGAYYDLEQYFNNPDYPGLDRNFSKDYLNSNRFFGKLYAVPLTQTFASVEGMVLRKDLMEAYGFDEIMTYDQLKSFFDAILENEPDLVPLAVEGRLGLYNLQDQAYELAQANIFDTSGGDWWVALNDDYTEVLGVTYAQTGKWAGDPEEHIANFPPPWNRKEAWEERLLTFKEWNKYLEPDSMSQTDPGAMFASGQAAAMFRGLGGSANVMPQLREIVPEAEATVFPYSDQVRNKTPHSEYITYKVWNFLCLPVTGNQQDRVMEFLDWVFQSEENHDLFELGIQGVHWEPVGESSYRRIDVNGEKYIFPWYQLTGTPNMTKLSADLLPLEREYRLWAMNEDRYALHPLTGFDFDMQPVESEKAKVDAIFGEIYLGIVNGAFEDPIAVTEKTNKAARGAGLEEMRAELLRQLQAFLDAKN